MKSSVYSIRVSYQLLNAIFEELDRLDIGFSSVSGALVTFIETKAAELGASLSLDDQEAMELVANRVSLCGRQTQAKKLSERSSGVQSSRGSSKVRTAIIGGASSEGRRQSTWDASNILDRPTTNLDFAPPSFNSNFEENLGEPADSGFGLEEVLAKGSEIIRQQTEQLDQDASDDLEQILQDSIAELERENSLALLEKLTGGFKVAKAEELPVALSKLPAISSRDPKLEKDKLWKAFLGEADEAKMYALRIVYYNLPEEFWSTEKAETMLLQVMENLR